MMTDAINRGAKIYANQSADVETEVGETEENSEDDESVDEEEEENETKYADDEHENEHNEKRETAFETDNNGGMEFVYAEDEENIHDESGREKLSEHQFTDEEHISGDEENEIEEKRRNEFIRL
ncbi:hypothetical protein DPMN_053224 [Dreissena polymorpha]|uniref:Uncharacterized protein n=1 Tax=Dreissena polymorpha TaxID=45954 RepID=A0A9D4CKZ3_DREPO|nr:hypothetical protein DPMN_053224 [Dreissena polymorpha]